MISSLYLLLQHLNKSVTLLSLVLNIEKWLETNPLVSNTDQLYFALI